MATYEVTRKGVFPGGEARIRPRFEDVRIVIAEVIGRFEATRENKVVTVTCFWVTCDCHVNVTSAG